MTVLVVVKQSFNISLNNVLNRIVTTLGPVSKMWQVSTGSWGRVAVSTQKFGAVFKNLGQSQPFWGRYCHQVYIYIYIYIYIYTYTKYGTARAWTAPNEGSCPKWGSLLPIWGRIWAAPTISSTLMPRFAHWHLGIHVSSTDFFSTIWWNNTKEHIHTRRNCTRQHLFKGCWRSLLTNRVYPSVVTVLFNTLYLSVF